MQHTKKIYRDYRSFKYNIDSLNTDLKKFDLVIIGFHKVNKHGKSKIFLNRIGYGRRKLQKKNKVILDVLQTIFIKPKSTNSLTIIAGLVARTKTLKFRDCFF